MLQEQSKSSTAVQGSIGIGTAFGTFGELLQGMHVDNDLDFLVTFPIDRHAQVILYPDSSKEIKVTPAFKNKSVLLAERLLKHYGLPPGGTLTIKSDLPVGKGLASSSADLVATARAVASAYGIDIPLPILQQFLCEIEPTDGVMYPGVVFFYHRKVEIGEIFGSIPRFTVVAIDEGGEVDTITYNQERKPFTTEEKEEYTELLYRLKMALQEQDVRTIGEVVTRSVIMNQSRREVQALCHLLEVAKQCEALGVVTAHSGTYTGVLLWQEEDHYATKLAHVIDELQETYGQVHVFHSLSGG
ncbi:kinase [Paenibacillus sp. N1-5-1-14]|uniref:GHMP family kinase ATP-binding protein n=1 Tax=Paenibacillus radicibacter TaxID=2972488 RepID=UPI002158D1D5|nr:kinase [Paenibacillus radicibacter]MCR8643268.1 kinase [Paenibacillus radicibacter]